MIDIYHHQPEVWDSATCERKAKYVAKDGMGTKYPFKGYLGSSASIPTAYGTQLYNGGCIRNGEHYKGEHFPFPTLAPGFEIVVVPTWGWRLIKKIS